MPLNADVGDILTMRNIRTVISGDVTIKKIVGAPTCDELMAEVREFYNGHTTKHIIWIFSEGADVKLTADDLNKIADLVQSHAHLRAGGKTAFVASRDHEFGMSRMLDAFGELRKIPFDTRTFRNLSDAAKWIGVDELPAIE